MFKGTIPANSQVVVKFTADHNNSAETHLLVALGRVGGTADEDYSTASPGGFARIRMPADLMGSPYGMLRIFVDMAVESDNGVLEVTADGQPLPNSNMPIKGDTTWIYRVK